MSRRVKDTDGAVDKDNKMEVKKKNNFALTLQAEHLNKCLFYKITCNVVANVGVLTAVSDRVTQASVFMSEAYVSDWTVMLELCAVQHYSQINKGSSSLKRTNGSFIRKTSPYFPVFLSSNIFAFQ